MNWKAWAYAAGIRAVKTFSQVLIVGLGGGDTIGVGLVDIDWADALNLAGGAALLSILYSLKGLPEVKDKTSVGGIYPYESM